MDTDAKKAVLKKTLQNQRVTDNNTMNLSTKNMPSPFKVLGSAAKAAGRGALKGLGMSAAAGIAAKGAKKVGNYLKENKRLNNEAAGEMDKRYPSGWAQSPANMTELNIIKKGLKNK